jgi:nitroreductase
MWGGRSSPEEIPLSLTAAIHARRSIKEFTPKPIAREAIERLLDAAAQAPNHRLTQPWRFYVLGPEARRAFGEVLGRRKAKKVENPEAAAAVVAKVADAHAALPAFLVVATVLDENPEIREEDYAATMMAVQNLCLAAHDAGLGTHIKSGAVMDDPEARVAFGLREGERAVVMIEMGEPARVPDRKGRKSATELTTWRP